MIKHIIITVTIISATLFFSCGRKSLNENSKQVTEKNTLKNDSLEFLDSTIALSKIDNSYFDINNLTEKEAKKCLYKYFKNKGVINHDELKGDFSESELCVDYECANHKTLRHFKITLKL